MQPPDNDNSTTNPRPPIVSNGHPADASHRNSPPTESSDVRISNKTPGVIVAAMIMSISATAISAITGIIHVGLLIHYEVTNGGFGDGFMLALPLLPWLFLVLPLCAIAAILAFVGLQSKGSKRFLLTCFILIVTAGILLPLLLVFTISTYV